MSVETFAEALRRRRVEAAEMLPDGRAQIDVIGGNFAHNVRAAIAALHSSGVPIYDRGGQLVRPVEHLTMAVSEDGVRRPDGALILNPVGADWLRVRLAEVALWRKFDARTEKWKLCNPPQDVARTIVAAPDEGAGHTCGRSCGTRCCCPPDAASSNKDMMPKPGC